MLAEDMPRENFCLKLTGQKPSMTLFFCPNNQTRSNFCSRYIKKLRGSVVSSQLMVKKELWPRKCAEWRGGVGAV